MQTRGRTTLWCFLILLFSPTVAEACGVCGAAMAEYCLPPFWAWTAVSMLWFLATSTVFFFNEAEVENVPSLAWAIGIVVFSVVAGALLFGPLLLLALSIHSVVVFLASIFVPTTKVWDRPLKRGLRILGGLVIGVCLALAFYSAHLRSERSDAEFIITWDGTGFVDLVISKLDRSGASALPELRMLLEHGLGRTATEASKAIARFGDPSTDVPLLIAALERTRSQSGSFYARDIEASLRALSGLDLPDETPIQSWNEQWAASLSSEQ